jgi:hypothetical protein
VLFVLLAGCPGPPATPVDVDLQVGISELCTACNDVIRCERDADAPDVAVPALVIYNLLEDMVWHTAPAPARLAETTSQCVGAQAARSPPRTRPEPGVQRVPAGRGQ